MRRRATDNPKPRIVQTTAGIAVLALLAFLLIDGRTHSDWFYVTLAGIGGFLVSKSLVEDLIKTASKLLPWKPNSGPE